ncbi:MAG: YchJ family protein [Spirochaetes bacterium]|nr:YchJ family protein [Spirochaetota bacterium]MBU0955435.1 YchJ family protein [Spirochaetota bacterium]
MTKTCPCGSGKSFAQCCEPIINGQTKALTAEALMRSRYSAYATGAISHIMTSCVQDDSIDEQATTDWSKKADWQGLKILRTEKGQPGDSSGLVEFVASYIMDGMKEEHHETANFVQKDQCWLYESGSIKTETVVRATPKVGRNDPCPCGSGKKFKNCCA